jgi:hypothetical protein
MIRTKNMASTISDVPMTWVFEKYLSLPEKLTGQDVKIKSVFNSKDKNPSFFVYFSKTSNKYKFKDFSADKQGNGIELVKQLFNLPKTGEAILKIINDYNDFILTEGKYSISDFKIKAKYKIKSVKLRNWSESDKKYWMAYKINSKLLEHYNVQPLNSFTLEKESKSDQLIIRGSKIYGYFKKDGTLYKIYQPLMIKTKFFKVKDYIQGIDQLTFTVPYLVICSSLKDAMGFCKMSFKNAEVIAPDSENTMIPERIIIKLKEKYKAICALFDNDEAGIRAMIKYKEKHNIPSAHLKLEKDLADCIEVHGINNTRELLYPILTKALTGTIKQLP